MVFLLRGSRCAGVWHPTCISCKRVSACGPGGQMLFPCPDKILSRRTTMKSCSMFLTIAVFIAAAFGAGCATTTTVPGATAYTGEVWTWDEQENWVTLRQ